MKKVAVWAESLEFIGAVLIAEGGEELGTVRWVPGGFEWEADSKKGLRTTRREAQIMVLRVIRTKLRTQSGVKHEHLIEDEEGHCREDDHDF